MAGPADMRESGGTRGFFGKGEQQRPNMSEDLEHNEREDAKQLAGGRMSSVELVCNLK